MCTLAGYVGEKNAAPILIEMSKRQEGLWAGFYTGLTTISKGLLHHDKVVGSTLKLENETHAASFPGTVGIVHSRTNSGGDKEWGQPFVDGSKIVSCAAQGSPGLFVDNIHRIKLGDELNSKGVSFRTAVPGPVSRYPVLTNGSSIHSTEIFCASVSDEYKKCSDPVEAIKKTALRIPTEAIYLLLFRDEPEKIFVYNFNQRLVFGRDNSGTYFASSSLSFPEQVAIWCEMPANAIAIVSKDTLEFIRFVPKQEFLVSETYPVGLEEAFLSYVYSHPGKTLGQVVGEVTKGLFPKATLVRKAAAGYQTLERLIANGEIRTEPHMVPGVNGQGEAPQIGLFLNLKA